MSSLVSAFLILMIQLLGVGGGLRLDCVAQSGCSGFYCSIQTGLAGAGGRIPSLAIRGSGVPGSIHALRLTGGAERAHVWFVLGDSLLNAPFLGGVLGPAPIVISPAGLTSSLGVLEKAYRLPDVVADGQSIYVQAWVLDEAASGGVASSDTLKLSVASSGPSSCEVGFPGRSYASGLATVDLAAGDLNGDGYADIVTANRFEAPALGDPAVRILYFSASGDGTQYFDIYTGSGARAVELADLDADGELEILVCHEGVGLLSVYDRRVSRGTFEQVASAELPSVGRDILVEDVFGDQGVEIIVACRDADSVVTFGDPELSSEGRLVLTVPGGPRSLASLDLGDESSLVAVACEVSDQLSVLAVADDRKRLELMTFIAVGDSPSAVISTALEGGRRGVAVACRLEDVVRFVALSSVGEPEVIGDVDVPGGPVALSMADGFMFVGCASSSEVRMIEGPGSAARLSAAASAGLGVRSLVALDLNLDGYVDVVTANAVSGDVTTLFGLAFGVLHSAQQLAKSGDAAVYSVRLADLNADGKGDLVYANSNSELAVVIRRSQGIPRSWAEPQVVQLNFPTSFDLGDLNGDGAVDAVTAGFSSGEVAVLRGDGLGGLVPMTYFDGVEFPSDVAVADMNGNGVNDVLISDWGEGRVVVGFSDGEFGFSNSESVDVGGAPLSLVAGDITGDGFLDVVVASEVGGLLTVIPSESESPYLIPGGAGPTDLALEDYDRDGDLDIAFSIPSANQVGLHTNLGDGAFGSAIAFPVAEGLQSLDFFDVNEDRWPDILTSNSDRGLSLFYGSVEGFEPSQSFAAGGLSECVTGYRTHGGEAPALISGNLSGGLWVLSPD